MAIHEHMKTFAGMPVREWGAGVDWVKLAGREASADGGEAPAVKLPPLRSPEKTLFRISLDYEEAEAGVQWTDKFARFLDQKNADKVAGIVVGSWTELDTQQTAANVIKALAKARKKLPNLRAIFLGDIVMEECEISWIRQGDAGRLLDAYPNLEHLGVRGGDGLKFQVAAHESLKTLVVETGGLPRKVLHQVFQADLPALEHLELWLGTDSYGADTTVEDLAPILSGDRFPKLKYLGLRDSDRADEIAAVIANAPVLRKLQVLDLSLGTLSDEGARSLMNSKAIKKLKKLDLRHHYCSPKIVKEFKALGVPVDLRDAQGGEDPEDRFVAVGE